MNVNNSVDMCCWVILHNLLNVWFDWTPIWKALFCQGFVHPESAVMQCGRWGSHHQGWSSCIFVYLCICVFVYLWFCIWYEHLDARMEGESVPSRLMICSLASLPGDTFTRDFSSGLFFGTFPRDFSSRLFLSIRGHFSSQHRQDAKVISRLESF